METKDLQQNEEQKEVVQSLSEDQKNELVKNELAVIPETERNEIMKVVKTADIVLIDSHKKKITSFKRRFPAKNFVITPDLVFSKEALEKATEQWREIRDQRTKVAEVDFDNLKAPYVAITKFYNEQTKPIIADYKAIEKPVSDYVDALEKLQKEEKQKEKLKAEALANERRDKLLEAGMAFDGNHYVIGSEEFEVPQISFDMADIQSLTDAIFERALANVIEAHKIIEQKTAEKKQKDADAETLRLKEEAEQKQKDEDLRLENLQKQKDLDAEKEQIRKDRIEMRSEALEGIGFVHDYVHKTYDFASYTISEEDLGTFEKQNWENWLKEVKAGIAKFNRTKTRVNELEAMGFTFNAQKKEYSNEGVYVSTDFIDGGTNGAWEECIVDAKTKLEAAKALAELKQKRHEQLVALGLHCDIQFQGYSYKKNGFDVSQHLKLDSDANWEVFVETFIVKNMKDIDTAIEVQNNRYNVLAPYATYGPQVDMNTLYSLEPAAFNKILEEKKQAYNQKLQDDIDAKKKEDDKKKADDLAKASDETKWAAFIEHLNNLPVLEMESELYKAKYIQAIVVIEAIKK